MKKITIIFSVVLTLFSFKCNENRQQPAFILDKVKNLSKQPVQNPPAKIMEYNYLGKRVYFIPAPCCDNMSELYDSTGTLLCHPDGGITGKGDGNCADFFEKRTGEKLIWEDSRR